MASGDKWTAADLPDLSEKVMVVTGANSGIGFEAARELARAGAHVVLACRSPERGAQALDAMREEVPEASAEVMRLDLADLSSVAAFAEAFLAAHDRLDVLVNNAGLMALPRCETVDGFEMQLGVNHLGHFALTGRLFDRLVASSPARVVTVSSGMHRAGRIDFDDLDHERSYEKWSVYSQSKLANLLFARELSRRIEDEGLDVLSVACHPGYSATDLQRKGPEMRGAGLAGTFWRFMNVAFAQTAHMGALSTLYAATAPDVRGGDYIGPRLFGMWGHPGKERPARAAFDADAARRLWEVSVERTGVAWPALR